MKALQHTRVLLATDDPQGQDHLSVWLRSEGAELHVSPWAQLREAVASSSPGVLLADYRGTPRAARILAELQRELGSAAPPTVVLLDSAAPADPLAAQPRVNKFVRVGAHPADVVSAVAGLASAATQPVSQEPSQADSFLAVLEAQLKRRDLRGLLALLNATGPFRYTSILRFDEREQLTSLWTFDRAEPNVDSFPVNNTVDSSYCKRILESGQPFEMPDAALDPSVQTHPARHSVLSYCGVPLLDESGSVFGTLCQFDVVPRYFQPSTVERLQTAASLLQRHLGLLSARTPAHAAP